MLCAQKSVVLGRAKAPVLPRRVVSVRCNAQKPSSEEPNQAQKFALPLASMVAAALIAGAVVPDEALAANSRSGGRVGGSSGFQARKAGAPSRSVQTQAAPTVNNTTVVVAPAPVISPFGFGMPFGGFGFGFGVPIFTPFPFFGPLLTFTFLLLVINVVFSVVKGFMASKEAKKDDSWGDL